MNFLDYVVKKFLFRIKYIQTDNGYEFQSKFHWHVEDLGMLHRYIKPRSPNLNGKVERSHLTDQTDFYQLISYKGEVDLKAKLKDWETFYNMCGPIRDCKEKPRMRRSNISLLLSLYVSGQVRRDTSYIYHLRVFLEIPRVLSPTGSPDSGSQPNAIVRHISR